MKSNYKSLGQYIQPVVGRNNDLGDLPLMGLSIQKKFIPSIANIIGTDMSTYRIIERNQFAFGPVTSRNGDKITIALFNDYEKALISQAYIPFEIKDTNELDAEYLMMWFRRPEFDRYARFKSHGSAREVFDWEELCSTLLPIPPITKQREIVKEYNVIQRRIDLNQQLIQKLEETARAIYRQWFADYEFPDGKHRSYKNNGGKMVFNEELDKAIPLGWDVGNLNELIEVKYGKDYSHLEKGSIPLYGSGGIMGYVNKGLYDNPSILIPRKGSLHNIIFINRPFWSVDTMFYSILKSEFYGCYVFYYLTSMDFNSLDVGSAVPSMTTDYLNGMRVIKPTENVLKMFDGLARRLLSKIEFTRHLNDKLIELQNLLLSKLATIEK